MFWLPHVTVSAIIEKDNRFLLVEEMTESGVKINQPSGHLEYGESLEEACSREVLEETGWQFRPTNITGVYVLPGKDIHQTTYVRVCFKGILLEQSHHNLDQEIIQTIWMSKQDVNSSENKHRSILVKKSIDDYLSGQSCSLDLLHFLKPHGQ